MFDSNAHNFLLINRIRSLGSFDSLLGYLSKNKNGVAVEAEDGSVLGIATATGVLEALANGSSVPPAKVKVTK